MGESSGFLERMDLDSRLQPRNFLTVWVSDQEEGSVEPLYVEPLTVDPWHDAERVPWPGSALEVLTNVQW